MIKRFKSFAELISAQESNDSIFSYLKEGQIASISYGELLEKVHKYPLPKEDVVGLFISNNIESIIALFALASKKQLIILDPNEREESLIKKIKATHVGHILFGDEELRDILTPHLEANYHTEDKDILFFTSGTTSESKAVVLTEQTLCNATFNGGSLLPLTKEDKLLAVLPLSHVFGLVCSILWPISFGATVCLGNGLRQIFTDFALYKPTVTTLVPEMAKFLVFNKLFNKELSLILIGAGSCDDMTINAIKALGIRLSYGYGLTESSSGIALSLHDNPRAMSICPDYKVRIAEDGEIIVKSNTTLMKGYYNDPKSTEATLIDGELHTGDLGKIEDGCLFITGRKKEILVFGDGSKLYIPEYEAKLLSLLGPGSDFCILQNAKGQVILYIYKPIDVENIVDEFNKTQSRSHKIEKIIYAKDKLPRTGTGKVMKYLIKVED